MQEDARSMRLFYKFLHFLLSSYIYNTSSLIEAFFLSCISTLGRILPGIPITAGVCEADSFSGVISL
ncbi:hypothetical protein EUTSA_v10009283mg [Eutrema salsugineum]|uniref:Uncharacterized protein n=1 Tax=Eutrema salsugineum TaxID=72664 RepID=V4KZ89_EUTSA|nr:hypothetical protein EUTSA_v10009283mg [Eutrema salsugineum]